MVIEFEADGLNSAFGIATNGHGHHILPAKRLWESTCPTLVTTESSDFQGGNGLLHSVNNNDSVYRHVVLVARYRGPMIGLCANDTH